jgi:hypothetical protein
MSSTRKRPVINIETLEVFPSIRACARKHAVSESAVFQAILLGTKSGGQRFEYLEDWSYWTGREKEKHTRKNNIFFI